MVLGLEGQPRGVLTAVGDRFNAEISRFYNASRQNSDNSREDVWHQHKALPDGAGMLQYSSNQGQEVMTIRLSAKFVETVSEETKKSERTAWDWLVIELEVPVRNTTVAPLQLHKLYAAARFYTPPLNDIPDPESTDDPPAPIFGGASLERFAVDSQGVSVGQQEPVNASDQPNPRLMFAGAPRAEQLDAPEVVTGDNVFRCSLLVDIRPNFWIDDIEVDIWAQLGAWELDKSLHTVITRAVANPDNINRVHAQYTGGATGRAWVEDNYPAIASTITSWVSRTSSFIRTYFWPAGITSSSAEADMINADNYAPTGLADNSADFQTWYFNNSDIFNKPLWEQNYSAQWADITSPYDWSGGGAWTSGGDMSAYLAQLDTMALPGDETFGGLLTGLGKSVYSIAGAEFWFQTEAIPGDTDGFSYGGNGDPGTPPPNNYAADASGPFARQFQFAAVRNTYIFQQSIGPVNSTTTTVTADCSIKAVALRSQFLDPVPPDSESSDAGQLVWTVRDCSLATDVLQAVTPSSTQSWRFNQWEQRGRYPGRWTMNPIPGAEAVPVDNQDDPANTFIDNMKFLGRVKFNQTGGGASFSWTPAAEVPADRLPVMPT